MVDLTAIKVVLQRAGGGLGCSRSLVDEARGQLKLVEEKFTSTNSKNAPCEHLSTTLREAVVCTECNEVLTLGD